MNSDIEYLTPPFQSSSKPAVPTSIVLAADVSIVPAYFRSTTPATSNRPHSHLRILPLCFPVARHHPLLDHLLLPLAQMHALYISQGIWIELKSSIICLAFCNCFECRSVLYVWFAPEPTKFGLISVACLMASRSTSHTVPVLKTNKWHNRQSPPYLYSVS
jgi:hypothetical protein